MQLFVISMHRSGSSVVSRLLNMMGAYFGAEGTTTAPNEENPKGFWERRDVRALNDRLLFSVGCDWHRISGFRFEEIPDDVLADARREAGRILLNLDAHRPWVLKEPRFCFTLPLYRPLLEVPIAILVHRDPVEVALSLRQRNGFGLLESVGLWEAYARAGWAATADMPRVVVNHARLMREPAAVVSELHGQLEALGVVGLRHPSQREIEAFIDPGLHRQHGDESAADGLLNASQVELARALSQGEPDVVIATELSAGGGQAIEHLESRLETERRIASAVETALAEHEPPPPEPEPEPETDPVEEQLEALEASLVARIEATIAQRFESQAEGDAARESSRREDMARMREEVTGLAHDQQSGMDQLAAHLGDIVEARDADREQIALRAQLSEATMSATVMKERLRTLLHFVDSLWEGYQALEGELSRRGGASQDVLALADETAGLARAFQEDLALTQGTAVWRFGRRFTNAIGALARLPKSGLEQRVVEHARAADDLDRRRDKARSKLPTTDEGGRIAVLRENRHLRPVYETVRGTALAQLYGLQDRFVPEASLAVILLPPYGQKLLESLLTQLQMHAAYRGYEIYVGSSAAETAGPWLRQLPIQVVPDDDVDSLAAWVNRCAALTEADILCLLETRLRLYQDPFSPLVRAFAESGADFVGAAPLEESSSSRARVSGIAARIGFDGERGVSLRPEAVDLAIAVEAAGDLTPFATPLAMRREAFERVGGLCTEYAGGDALEDLLLKLRFDSRLRGHLLTNLAITARGQQRVARKPKTDARLINARFGQRLRRHFFEHLLDNPVSVVGRPFTVAFAVTDCDSAGDYLTARELGGELARQFDWAVRYLPREQWYELSGIDVVVAMIDDFDPPAVAEGEAHLIRVAWARNWFERWLERPGSDDFDLFLSASSRAADQARTALGHRSRTFRIATNAERFADEAGARDLDYLFTGSHWGVERDIMRWLVPAELPWTGVILGRNWDDFEPFRESWRGFVDYEALPAWYGRARIVIDDANHVTRDWGSVNSRVYDALACGCLVVTNSRSGSEDAFDGLLPVYESRDSLAALLDDYLNDEPRRQRLVRRLRGIVLKRHSYAQRATQFRELVAGHLRAPLRYGIKVPCPDRAERHAWGDYHYARGIARVLRSQGHTVRLDFLPEWQRPAAATDDVVIVLRGLSAYEPRAGQVNLLWQISHPDAVEDAELAGYDHVFVASATHAARLAERLATPVSVLLQCTDATLFDREATDGGSDVELPTFVGNTREQYRPAVRDAIAAGIELAVYGKGWQGLIPDSLICGDHIPNDALAEHYASARYVLNDHWPDMARHGFISNRIFDAALAGATVVTDPVAGLDEVFGDLVFVFRNHRDLERINRRLSQEDEESRAARTRALRQLVRSRHSFEHRVQTLRDVAEALTAVPALPRDVWQGRVPGDRALPALAPAQRALLRDRSLGRLTVLVVAWDMGHNPLGRAYMLAEALARHFHVIVLGPAFERYGDGLWPPLRGHANVTLLSFPGRDTDSFLATAGSLAGRVDADLVLACKPRLPSVGLGILAKLAGDRPLIIDIDDHELAFFRDAPPLPIDADLATLPERELPFGEGWTRFTESLLPAADALLVSNPALQEKFGGVVVPHARDELRFDPERYDRSAERARLGLPEDARIVLFLGTPRPHKGLSELLEAVLAQTGAHGDVHLCVIGAFDDRGYRKTLVERGGDRLHLLPDQPFAELPRNLAVADAICLMQQPDHPISRYQLPAKLIDAIAMGIPVLVTETAPVAPIVRDGLATATTLETLVDDLGAVLAGTEQQSAAQRRRAFLARFSYQAINETLVPLCMKLLKRDSKPVPPEIAAVFEPWRPRPERPQPAGAGLHLVFLWKQADSGLYGRRIDMLARYALADDRVASVAIFDAPVAFRQLRDWEQAERGMQHRHVATRIWRKRWGLEDRDGLSWHSFVHGGGAGSHPKSSQPWPEESGYPDFVRSELERTGRNPTECIFVTYPVNELLPSVIDACKPRFVIADVVDDQRTWPGLDDARRAALDEAYRSALTRADAVIANCLPVQASMAGYADNIVLIENAAEPTSDGAVASTPPDALRELAGPLVGYVGNFEPAKFDEALLRNLAETSPAWQFVLIGSTHMNPDLPTRMADLPNVHFPGVVPYDDLDAWVGAFDCAIIPHLDTEQTRSMNPLKCYVYAAAGVPIVSSAVANLASLDEAHLRVVRGERAFRHAIASAMERGRPERIQVPADQCWPERVTRMLALLPDGVANGGSEDRA